MPKRAKSKRLAAVAMNSMAQHAVPNGMGHNELARAQLTRSSSRASSQLGLWPATSLVSMTCFMAPGDASIPFESAPLPDVHVSHEQQQEGDVGLVHGYSPENHPSARGCQPNRVA